MLLVKECNIVSHTQARGSVQYIPGEKEGACIVMAPPSYRFPSSTLFHPVLGGGTASNVKSFEVLLLYSCTLGQWEKIFQCLEA